MEDLLTTTDAGNRVGFTRHWMRRLAETGRLRSVRTPRGDYLFEPWVIEELKRELDAKAAAGLPRRGRPRKADTERQLQLTTTTRRAS